jgi:serine/threonine protein kinase
MILKKEFEGRSADMWSLGAIILEITLGFTHEWIESYNKIDSDARVFQKGLQGCLAEIPKERYPLHQKLLAIIHSCLSIEPADRISSKEALHHPWLSTLTGFTEHRQDYQEPPVLDCCDPRPPTFPDLL